MQKTCKRIGAMAIALAAYVALSGNAIAATDYTITDLGTLTPNGMSYATGINNNGQVVGWSAEYDTTTGTTAFIWDSTKGMKAVGTSGAATAINNSGQVVGYTKAADGSYQAFLYSGGSLQALPSSYTGKNSSAYAINNIGMIGGTLQTDVQHIEKGKVEYTNYRAALWSGGNVTQLSQLSDVQYDVWGGPVSQVYSINDSGIKVGKSSVGAPAGDDNGDPASHAVLWDSGGNIVDLGTLGTCNTATGICTSAAFGINAKGLIVGVSGDSTNTNLRPFLYINGQMKDLGTITGATNGYAYAINNNKQAVGYSSDFKATDPASGTVSSSFTSATLWNFDENGNATPVDLNTLLAQNSGWELWGATGINDNGQIVGYGKLGEGPEATFHAILLNPATSPVPLPPAFFLFGSGLAGILGFRRKFKA